MDRLPPWNLLLSNQAFIKHLCNEVKYKDIELVVRLTQLWTLAPLPLNYMTLGNLAWVCSSDSSAKSIRKDCTFPRRTGRAVRGWCGIATGSDTVIKSESRIILISQGTAKTSDFLPSNIRSHSRYCREERNYLTYIFKSLLWLFSGKDWALKSHWRLLPYPGTEDGGLDRGRDGAGAVDGSQIQDIPHALLYVLKWEKVRRNPSSWGQIHERMRLMLWRTWQSKGASYPLLSQWLDSLEVSWAYRCPENFSLYIPVSPATKWSTWPCSSQWDVS